METKHSEGASSVPNEFSRRVGDVRRAVTLVVFAALSLALWVVTVTAIPLVLVTVGIPLLGVAVPLLLRLANFHRRWAGDWLGTSIEAAYLPLPANNLLARVWAYAKDPAVRRDLIWLTVNGTVGLVITIVAIVETLLGLIFWWLPGRLLLGVHARICRALLSPSAKSVLAQRVAQLRTSRAETVDIQATEIRRIERDLHDGAQARLVALGMNLGMAEELLTTDPQRAAQLLAEAREASGAALAELRGVVRGIHPPVLADRGLVGAVQALALASTLPVTVDASVPERLPAPAESAAYFALAEALTNAVKHSGARSAQVTIRHDAGLLRAEVRDDGRGGADVAAGTGLRGIERRLGVFDGRLIVDSPPGGPTLVTMELPCELSSPRITPSSETA